MNLRRHSYRYQRTIGRRVELLGVGFLTGASVRIAFQPAPPSTGIIFVRVDRRPAVQVPAQIERVTGTTRRTTLGQAPAHVSLVEHVLAALAGLRIDNCYVELNASEPPGLDGSAQRFADVLCQAGTVLQPAQRTVWCVVEPVTVAQAGATLTLYPPRTNELKISYALDYGLHTSIDRQLCTQVISPESFLNNIAHCRTFLLEAEATELRRQGLGSRTTAADLLVFGPRGPIDNTLRYANEPARHKILDLIGDLSLFGQDLCGHVVACRSGHPLNIELVNELSRQVGFPVCGCTERLAA
jgi:UDP-3-O-[3-hydroxymyristoyl] N-acetylglucosamine deacetylase